MRMIGRDSALLKYRVRLTFAAILALLLLAIPGAPLLARLMPRGAHVASSFTLFESGQVRPLALAPNDS